MAIMARVLGIPSRVAVGFLEPEKATNGTWEFSAHDLHAWPELYFPGSGWVRFEPTPAGPRPRASPATPTAEFAPVARDAPRPSASRSTELLPDRGATPSADTGSADDDTSRRSRGCRPGWACSALLLVVGLLLLTPRLVRRARRRRRLAGDIEDLWVELRDARRRPRPRAGRRPLTSARRRVAGPAARLRPSPTASVPTARAAAATRHRRRPQALDRLVERLERSRYSATRRPSTAEQFARRRALVEEALAAGVTPRDVRRAALVAGLGRRTPYVLAPALVAPRPDRDAVDETSRTVDELVG